MLLLHRYLLEGEPDGSGAISTDQPITPEPASTPAEDASDTPASELEEQPADTESETPVDEWTDDDRSSLIDLDGDNLLKHPKMQAAIDAAAQRKVEADQKAAQHRPDADPFYRALSQESAQAYRLVAAAQEKITAGEYPDDPDQLLAALDVTGAWQAASERRGQNIATRAALERAIGIDPAKLDDAIPLQKDYADALTALETVQQNAYRLRQQAVREYDPQKRGSLITKAEQMDAGANGAFIFEAIKMAVAHGREVEAVEQEKRTGKRIADATKTARENGNTEAIARAKRTLAGAGVNANVPTKAANTGPLTIEEAQTLSIDELIRRSKAQ